LWSGALHYFRLDPDAWDSALASMKALGVQIVESYVPWSVHEITEGNYDFGVTNARHNLDQFLQRVAAADMLAFLRPGPHINAELTHFGLPDRIVEDDTLWARSPTQQAVPLIAPPHMFAVPSYASHRFRDATAQWFAAFAGQVKPHLWPHGPVVLLQVDNEAAFYFRDGPYDQDYHPDAITFHRARMRDRYRDDDALSAAYGKSVQIDSTTPPSNCRAETPSELLPALDWMQTHEELICDCLGDMAEGLRKVGLGDVPFVHNLPMGDFGLPTNVASVDRAVGLAGLDYYQTRNDYAVIRRRTLRLSGTVETPFAPELGAGAPPWFVPRTNDDSMFTALTALAFGLRGLNLYMMVARDRWYGAPIDVHGARRPSSEPWSKLFHALHDTQFASLRRHARIALVVPRHYSRLSRATHKLGAISPSVLDLSGTPAFSACARDTFGFEEPIQLRWWRWLDAWDAALTHAQVPFVYIDDDAAPARFDAVDVLIAPAYETFNLNRWQELVAFGARKHVIYGPKLPHVDEFMRDHAFVAPGALGPVLAHSITAAAEQLAVRYGAPHRLRLTQPLDGTSRVDLTVHENAEGPRVLFLINPGTHASDAVIETPDPLHLRDVLSGERFHGRHEVIIALSPQSCRMLVVDAETSAS
jgi:beta-galactosidase